MGRLVATLASCLLLGGCGDASPFAVRTGPNGGVEVVYANCDMEVEKLVRIAFVIDEGKSYDENAPKIWQLDFPTPAALPSVEVGQTPDGAVETIPWQQPAPEQNVRVVIAYEQRPNSTPQWFTLKELSEGQTLHWNEWVSAEEFAARCD